jgi:nucleolar protein 58
MAAEQPKKWEIKEARKYNPDADGLAGDEAPATEAAPADSSSKKEKKDKKEKKEKKEKKKKLIEEIPEGEPAPSSDAVQADVDMDNGEDEAESQPDDPIDETEAAAIKPPTSNPLTNGANGVNDDDDDSHSDTIPTPSADSPDSPDSPTAQERNWQSSITGNTKEAKKKRKLERHERKLAMSEDKSAAKKARNEKLARKLDRKERREAKARQVERRAKRDDEKYLEPAAKCGLSITRYKRKLGRGEIVFGEDGSVTAISKKEIKKMKKRGEDPAKVVEELSGKKRKRSEEDGEVPDSTKSEKKKKKSKG